LTISSLWGLVSSKSPIFLTISFSTTASFFSLMRMFWSISCFCLRLTS
jgi:hypothetical protein